VAIMAEKTENPSTFKIVKNWGRNVFVTYGIVQISRILTFMPKFFSAIPNAAIPYSMVCVYSLIENGVSYARANKKAPIPSTAYFFEKMDWKKLKQGKFHEFSKFVSIPVFLVGTTTFGLVKGLAGQFHALSQGIDDAKKGVSKRPMQFNQYRSSTGFANALCTPIYNVANKQMAKKLKKQNPEYTLTKLGQEKDGRVSSGSVEFKENNDDKQSWRDKYKQLEYVPMNVSKRDVMLGISFLLTGWALHWIYDASENTVKPNDNSAYYIDKAQSDSLVIESLNNHIKEQDQQIVGLENANKDLSAENEGLKKSIVAVKDLTGGGDFLAKYKGLFESKKYKETFDEILHIINKSGKLSQLSKADKGQMYHVAAICLIKIGDNEKNYHAATATYNRAISNANVSINNGGFTIDGQTAKQTKEAAQKSIFNVEKNNRRPTGKWKIK
jgi:hypothetical protein